MKDKSKRAKGFYRTWRGRFLCIGCGLVLFLLAGASNTHTKIQVDPLKMESSPRPEFSYDETVKDAAETVSHVTIGVTGEYVNLRWQSPKACDGYYIERKEAEGVYERIGVRNAKEESAYSDRKVFPGEEYTYRIRPYRKIDDVIYIERGYETQTVSVPLATPVITGLTYEEEASDILLEWKKIPYADWYEVYEKKHGIWSMTDSTKENHIRILTAGSEASEFRVRAVRQCNDGILYSNMEEKGVAVPDERYRKLRILFDGDSIAMGKGFGQLSACPISQRVGTLLGCEVRNQSVSCSVSGPKEGRDLPNMYERIRDKEAVYEGYDVICLGMGTNDFTFSVPLGTKSDTEADGTFYGYMKYIIQAIHQQNPEALIVLQTPPYRLRVGSSYEMTGWDSPNRDHHTMQDYQDALVELAGMEAYVYVYISQDADIINESNADTILYDGLHPCDEGYAQIGNDFTRYLKEEVLDQLQDPKA